MKPRTKLQLRISELSNNLPDIRNKMLVWAKKDCLEHIGYATKHRVVCMDCGQQFTTGLIKSNRAVCPHCGSKLTVKQSRRTTDEQRQYIAIAEVHHEFQVIRNFYIQAYYKSGNPPKIFIMEVLQHWIMPNGKHEVIACNHAYN